MPVAVEEKSKAESTISWEHASHSVHEGNVTAIVVSYVELDVSGEVPAMRVLVVVVGVVLFAAAGEAGAQGQCRRTYYGEEHSSGWDYLTIDARSRGQPSSSGITIQNEPTQVCGHNGARAADGNYCGEPADHEWRFVSACGTTHVILSVDPATVDEGDGSTPVTLTGTLNWGTLTTATAVTVSVGAGTDSATEGTDYTTVNDFTLTINANQMEGTATFALVPTDDGIGERAETVTVSGSTTATDLTVNSATLTITDNDREGVTVAPTALTVTEGSSRSYTLKLNSQPTGDVTVTVDGASGDVTVDKETLTFTTVNWGTEQTVTVRAAEDDDAVADPPVTLTHTVSGGGYAGVSASDVTVNVTEDDTDQRVKLSMGGDSEWVMEGDPPSPITVNALLTGEPRNVETRVDVHLDPDEATPGLDFEPVPLNFRITIPANAQRASHTFTFAPKADDEEEKAETLMFTGTSDRPVDSTTMMIKDNDSGGPTATADSAETREDEPAAIDVLANDSAANGSRLRVTGLTAPEHGTASVVSGGVRYMPLTNYYGQDRFSYTVADSDGLTDTATVTVTVMPVNDPPEAVDDAAETREDAPVMVDVLGNDTDVDGDRLVVMVATVPGHGSATVVAGGVRYTPSLDYHGPDRFQYTIRDAGGLTATASVALVVLPVNDAPEAVGAIPAQGLEEGGEAATVHLSPYFTDADGDALTYTVESSDPAATAVRVDGSVLKLTAVVTGVATVTVTATDALGSKATQVFDVTVGDRLVREVLTDTLAAVGRGHLSSVRQTVGRRLETAGADRSRLTLAGRYFSPTMWNSLGTGSLAQTHEWYFRAAMQQRRRTTGILGTSADPQLRESGFLGFGGFVNDWNRALLGTDMLLAFGSGETATDSGRGRTRWTVWGQGDLQMFRGSPSDVKGYEGDLRTGYVGVDAQLTRRWLLGVALARSGGTGMWQRGASAGELSTTLTRVHPYVRWANDDTVVWGVLGAGRGAATHVRKLTGLRETSSLGLGLGLLEGRRRVATVRRGLQIGLRGEASWARLATAGGADTIDVLEAGVRRMRGGIEVTRALSGPRGLTFTPFGAVSTRHDGGAGPTGLGLEVAGGMRVRGGRLQVEAQGRRLVLHSATAYEEQGVSVAASVGAGRHEPGLTLSVRPTWGAPGMGAETLWQDQIHDYMPGGGYDASGIDARLGYGVRLRGGGLLTPFGAYGQRQGSGRRLQVGALVGSPGRMPGAFDAPIRIEVSGERYDRPGASADHRVGVFGVVNLGGGGAPDTVRLDHISTSAPPNSVVVNEMTQGQLPPVAATETRTNEVAPAESPGPAVEFVEAAPVEAAAVEVRSISFNALADEPATLASGLDPGVSAVPNPARRDVVDVSPSSPGLNRPPMFSAPTYAFEVPARRDGKAMAVPLGAVLARDPDRGPVTYSVTAGDWTRFKVEPSSGAITYVGPDLPGSRQFKLQVTARDRDRLTAIATVMVTVPSAPAAAGTATTRTISTAPRMAARHLTADASRSDGTPPVVATVPPRTPADAATPPIVAALPASVARSIAAARAAGAARSASTARPASPARRNATSHAIDARPRTALADTARTYMDVPVLIDVQGNDAARSGLRIVAVTPPAHGTATVTDGMVRYAPAGGYRGRDAFIYTVVGDDGRMARATVTVIVG